MIKKSRKKIEAVMRNILIHINYLLQSKEKCRAGADASVLAALEAALERVPIEYPHVKERVARIASYLKDQEILLDFRMDYALNAMILLVDELKDDSWLNLFQSAKELRRLTYRL